MSENEKRGLIVPVEANCYRNMLNTIKRQRLELTCWRITGLVLIVANIISIYLTVKG